MASYNECIIFLLAKAYQKAHGNFKRRLQDYGLTPIQYLILEVLWDKEGVTAGDIGKKLVLDSATLSGVLDRLAEKKWILKEADHHDKRALRIHLSERANGLQRTLLKIKEEADEDLLKKFTLEEKVLLKRLLRDLKE